MYEKKYRDGKIITKGRTFDPGKLAVKDKVELTTGEVGTITMIMPLGKKFLIEFEDLDRGATETDVKRVVESGPMGRLLRKEALDG